MKKFLSLILSIALVFSLCVPAVAVEELDPPLYEEYGYASMEEMITEWEITEEEYWSMVEDERFYDNWKYNEATGDMDPAVWEHEGYSSKEEYLSDWGLTEEEYDEIVTDYRVSYDWHYDEATGDFDPPLWRGYGFESKKDMLKEWEITEEEYYEQVENERVWKEQESWTDEQWDAYFEEQLKAEKEAMGLVYDINVMYNNQPLSFTDAVPEITNDRVMVPLRAVMENMGADVQYDDAKRTAVITCGDTQLTFVLGSDSFTITTGGVSENVTLDSTPYIKDGRVFVPIRFVAESLGYDVLWSNYYRTGVYLDKETIVSQLNENFTVLNGVLKMGSGMDLTKNYKGNVDMDLKITAFDSIAGDQTFTVGLDAVVIENQTSASMTMEFDIATIIDLLKAMAAQQGEDMEDPDLKLVFDMLKALNDDSVDMIIDLDKGVYYMRGSFLALMGKEAGVDMDDNTWIELDMAAMTGVDFADIMAEAQALAENMTMGDLLYYIYTIYTAEGSFDPVSAYDYMLSDIYGLEMLNDSAFKKSGSGYKYKYDIGDLIGVDGLDVNANITMKDGVASRVVAGVDFASDEFTMNFDLDTTAMEAKMSGKVHVKNTMNVEFTLTSTVAETSEAVLTAPPAGAKIIPYEDIADIA